MNNLSLEKEIKIKEFYKYLGPRFKEIHNTSDGAPVDICAIDSEEKEYWIRLVNNLDTSITNIQYTGIKIENVTFYQLYAMVSNNQSVFHMELFNDGFALFFINDLTPEQLKITEEYTMIGVSSALHIEMPQSRINVVPTTSVPYSPVNNIVLPKLQKVTGSFSFN